MTVSKGDNNSLTVILTRPEEQSRGSSRNLSELGFEVIVFPTITIEIAQLSDEIRAAFQDLKNGEFDWLIFTSANGVRAFSNLQIAAFAEKFLPDNIKVAVVGNKTAEQFKALFGRSCDLVPADQQATGLMAELRSRVREKERVLISGAKVGRGGLESELEKLRVTVSTIAVYETRPSLPELREIERLLNLPPERLALIFYSPSAFLSFLSIFGDSAEHFKLSKIVSVGPVTSQAIRSNGFRVSAELDDKSDTELILTLKKLA